MVVLHHTDSGIKRLADHPELLAESFEVSVSKLDAKAVGDPYAPVSLDVDIVRRTLPAGLLVSEKPHTMMVPRWLLRCATSASISSAERSHPTMP